LNKKSDKVPVGFVWKTSLSPFNQSQSGFLSVPSFNFEQEAVSSRKVLFGQGLSETDHKVELERGPK